LFHGSFARSGKEGTWNYIWTQIYSSCLQSIWSSWDNMDFTSKVWIWWWSCSCIASWKLALYRFRDFQCRSWQRHGGFSWQNFGFTPWPIYWRTAAPWRHTRVWRHHLLAGMAGFWLSTMVHHLPSTTLGACSGSGTVYVHLILLVVTFLDHLARFLSL